MQGFVDFLRQTQGTSAPPGNPPVPTLARHVCATAESPRITTDPLIPTTPGDTTRAGGQVGGPLEDITATFANSGATISFVSVYVGGWGGSPYSWSGTFPVGVGSLTAMDSLGGTYTNYAVTVTSTSTSSYRNHGVYVSSTGGGIDAAHSCIGMPVDSQ